MKRIHNLCIFGSIALWGTSSITIMKLNEVWAGLQTLAFAFLFASIFLVLLAWKQGKLAVIKTYKPKDYAIFAGMGILGIFAYNMFNTYSYIFATGTQAAAINYLWPLWTILFGVAILKEKLTLKIIAATALSLFGMLLVVTRGNFTSFVGISIFGITISILGSICYGLFSALTKKLHYDKTLAMMLYFSTSTVIAFACLFIFSSIPTFTLETTLWLLLRGFGQLALGYVLWTIALMGNTARASNLALITPFIQLTTIALFMGETIGIMPILGLFCIISGVLIARKQ